MCTPLAAPLLAALAALSDLPRSPDPPPAAARVVVVTVDGLRWQEVFRGVDAELIEDAPASGVQDPEPLRPMTRGTRRDRREALLPFFWRELAPRGIVWGNRDRGSRVSVANPQRISLPGYAEMLTGRVQRAVRSNEPVRIPCPTFLEHARSALGLERTGVALFASWQRFDTIAESVPGTVLVDAGLGSGPTRGSDSFEPHAEFEDLRPDEATAELALDHLRTHRPTLLHVALGETDEWAHERRYDRAIGAARRFDAFLAELWTFLQSDAAYADKTTLLIATDHGRGTTRATWISHGRLIPRSDEAWLAVIGPWTPDVGEVYAGPELVLAQVAATALAALGLDPEAYHPDAAPPLPGAIDRGE